MRVRPCRVTWNTWRNWLISLLQLVLPFLKRTRLWHCWPVCHTAMTHCWWCPVGFCSAGIASWRAETFRIGTFKQFKLRVSIGTANEICWQCKRTLLPVQKDGTPQARLYSWEKAAVTEAEEQAQGAGHKVRWRKQRRIVLGYSRFWIDCIRHWSD